MIKKEAKEVEIKNVYTKDTIINKLGTEIGNALIEQIKKDVNNCGIGKEIFPSDILGEKSGSWRREYQAVYDFFEKEYENTEKDPWNEARIYIGQVFKYVIHYEFEEEFLMYSKEKRGNERNAYIRVY